MSDGDGRTKEANTFKTIIPPSDLSVSVLSKANEREVERRSSEVYLEGHLPSDTKCQVYVDGLSGAKCQVLSNSSNEEQTQKDDRNFDRRNDLAPLQFLPDKLSQVYDNQLSPVDPPSPGHHRGSSKHFLPASSFSFNGYEELSAKVNGCCYSKPSKQKSENETKLRHVSFDWPKSERESLLKTCPSLDGSVSLPPDPLSEIQQFGGSDNFPSSATFSDTPASVTVNISRSSFAPSTPASVIASQASLDSGVLSVRSFDLSQNSAFDAAIKRKRTASSVSSGIGELGQTSLDNEGPLPTAVSDASNSIDSCHRSENILSTPILAAKPSGKGDGCKVILDSVAGKHSNKESVSDSSPEQQPIGAQLSAHGKVDHSFVLPETGLDSRNVFPSVIFPVASEESLLSSVTLGEKAAAMERSPFQIVPSESMVKALRSPEVGDLCGKSSLYSPEALKKIEKFALNLVMLVLNEAFSQSVSLGWSIKCSGQCSQELCREDYKKKNLCREIRGREGEKSFFSSLGLSSCSSSLCWTPELPFSPCHRPYSRTSKRSSSLSVSHDSLIGGPAGQDVSHLIKGAVSHDALLAFPVPKERKDEKGTCVVCLDNDVYSLPVDVVKPYQGPILQPKVIIQQPKKKHHQNIRLHLEGDAVVSAPSSKKTHKKKGGKHSTHRGRTIAASNSTESSTSKRVVQSNGEVPQSSDASVCTANTDKSEKNGVKKEKEADKHDTHHQKEIKCYDQSKLCKIIPFSSHKPHKRKEIDSKMDRKKSKSISSNIRNTLVTFFSFRRAHKENGNCINAKNEFIDASSQGFFESSEGVKWGKICPLPSAPPLRTSVKYSAFSDHSGSTNVSGGTKNPTHNHKKENTTATDPAKVNHANSSHSNGSISHHRQSNSISPASLLSCLGHPRTNSINEQEPRTRSRLPVEASKQLLSMPPSSKSSGLGLVTKRALPPLPPSLRKGESHPSSSDSEWKPHTHDKLDEGCDFASIIEKVKNYGWYWGPISGEAAEKVLSNEPDGSFIVRDSSDYHYIFSLTFRLNGVTRHVRIEHDQGNFSFGGFTRFKSQTIVDFIEKAVEHSRSGRYLFFLHRRPVLGPMRVQLLHPVSRFKHVQSLQHLCRFVIVKQVRKDLIHDLPLPQRLKDYLSSPHYYSEQVEQCMSSSNAPSIDGTTASPERRNRSPCFRHNSQQPQVQARFESPVISLPSSSFNFCASRSSRAEASGNGFSLNLRCNFGDLSTSVGPSKRKKTRDSRLSSSHSSLENNSLWPVSPSTLSSESNAGQTGSHSFNAKKASQLLYGSSHSSPSSPVPLDYSPPDWLSSSEDVFQLQTKSVELPPTTAHLLCNDGQRRGIKPGGGIGSPADNENQKTNRSEHNCGQSASSVASPSFTNAFVLDDRRRAHDSQKVSEASATEAIKKYDLRLKINFENTYNENQSLLSTTKEN